MVKVNQPKDPHIKPFSENFGIVFNEFYIVRIVQFGLFQCTRTQNICVIMLACNKTIQNENSDSQLTQNSNSFENFYTKTKKVNPEALHGDFLLKIGILWLRDIGKSIPFFKYKGPPLAPPITEYHGIMIYSLRFYKNA